MVNISRRAFHRTLGVAIATLSSPAVRAAAPRVVVIGGGFGGTSVAKYLRRHDPGIAVTLIEPKKTYHTCPFSSHVIAGLSAMGSIAQGYDALRNTHGVTVVQDHAVSVDHAQRMVALKGGGRLGYDRLVMAPGIGFRWDDVAGYDAAARRAMPHAWNAGPQTVLLRRQLRAMDDGGLVIVSPPPGLYRCGPAPYERVSLIADYLRREKPRSKILVLDPKDKFSQQDKFRRGWEQLYGGMIELLPLSEDGKIIRVDAKSMTVETDFGEIYTGAVINFIPAQRAGDIARVAGLTDASGWCPVDPVTFESTLAANIHVLGDCAQASPMPKSAYSANSQAQAVALAIAALLGDKTPPPSPVFGSLCYSLVGPRYGIRIAATYRVANGAFEPDETPQKPDAPGTRATDAANAAAWYENITQEVFG
jgi:sulfide dehydrogenase [flavocytochrome c] flavoprotein subunit